MPNVLRPLSPSERTVWRMSAGASLNFSTIARLRGTVGIDELRRGLEAAQRRHPLLRATIDENDPAAPVFVADSAEPIPIELGAAADLVELAERELVRQFDCARVLARATWLPAEDGGTLVLTLHHAISDGKSGVFLLRDVVQAAASDSPDTDSPDTDSPDTGGPDTGGPDTGGPDTGGPDTDSPDTDSPDTDSPDTGGRGALVPLGAGAGVDDRLDRRARGVRGGIGLVRFLAADAWSDLTLGKAASPRHDVERSCADRTIRWLPRALEPSSASALAAAARDRGTTVHGALLAAIALGVAADRGPGRHSIYLGSPIDLRDELSPPAGEAMGFFVSMLPFRRRIAADDDLWQLAREIRGGIVAGKRTRQTHVLARGLPLVDRVLRGHRLSPTEFVRRWEKVLQSTAGLTNLGRLPIRTEFGRLRIESCQFVTAPSALGTYVCAVTSLHGRLHWNFTFASPTFTAEHAEALTDDTVARLAWAVERA